MRTPFLRKLVGTIRTAGEIQPREFSRRDFLRTAALAGAGALSGCATFSPRESWSASNGAVAIIGGGVAGLTAAYRLQQRGIEVHLYEAQQRLGGRMWTQRGFNDDGMFCEIGGELVDSNHTALMDLCGELGIGIQRFKAPRRHASEVYFIDGKLYTDAELIAAFAPIAKRIACDSDGLYDKQGDYTAKARAFDRIKLSDYLRTAGRETNTAEWVVRTLDLAYVTEYGLATEVQSTMNFLDMISPDTSEGLKLYGDSDEALRIRGGSGTLPETLAKRLDGKIHLHQGHRLTAIADDGKRIALSFDAGRERRTAEFSKVILALPFTVLREVSGVKRLALSEAKHRAIAELGYGANAKVMLGFHDRFWEKLSPARSGVSFSEPGIFESWETSRDQTGHRGILTCYIGGKAAQHFSNRGAVAAYLDRLETIFPGAKSAHDGRHAQMDWTHFAFAKGSFSSPLVGQYCGMIADAATPELGGRLHFAGEHTCEEFPGYMNGGVVSGERAAREVLSHLRQATSF